METVRYLGQEENQRTRELYEIAFPEDSREFVNYYYTWKTKENKILVMENEKGVIQVMMHLNPYQIHIHDCRQEIPYIVAVATHPAYRRQGKMRKVMERALQDMADKQVPFTFLLPADAAYYESQGFVFSPCQKTVEKPSNAEEWNWRSAKAEDISNMVEFSNKILAERCHIYIQRDDFYYQRAMKETEVENGGILLSEYRGKINGILVYGTEICEEEPVMEEGSLMAASKAEGRRCAEVKELLLDSDAGREEMESLCQKALPDCEISLGDFQMMVRVTSLKSFVPTLRRETPLAFQVKVKDDIIEENNGHYWIEIDKRGGRIEKVSTAFRQSGTGIFADSHEKIPLEMDISKLSLKLLEEVRMNVREWV